MAAGGSPLQALQAMAFAGISMAVWTNVGQFLRAGGLPATSSPRGSCMAWSAVRSRLPAAAASCKASPRTPSAQRWPYEQLNQRRRCFPRHRHRWRGGRRCFRAHRRQVRKRLHHRSVCEFVYKFGDRQGRELAADSRERKVLDAYRDSCDECKIIVDKLDKSEASYFFEITDKNVDLGGGKAYTGFFPNGNTHQSRAGRRGVV